MLWPHNSKEKQSVCYIQKPQQLFSNSFFEPVLLKQRVDIFGNAIILSCLELNEQIVTTPKSVCYCRARDNIE